MARFRRELPVAAIRPASQDATREREESGSALTRLRLRFPSATWACLGLIAALYLVAAWGYGKPFDSAGEPSYLIRAGTDFADPERLPAGTYLNEGTGYDGQFVFYIAQDPFLQSAETQQHLDAPEYRYRRILLPLAGWLTSAGEPEVLQWTLPLINLLALLASCYVLAGFLKRRGVSEWFVLMYALTIGVLIGVLNDLADPLAASLFVMGVVWWAENKTLPALVALGTAPFARELFLIPLAGIALIELLRWRRRAGIWLAPVGAFALWWSYLSWTFRDTPAPEISSPSVLPLVGAVEKLGKVLRDNFVAMANWELSFIVVALAVWSLLAVRAVQALTKPPAAPWPSRERLIPVAGLLSLITVPFLTEALWTNPLSYARYLAPASAVLLMVYASSRDRWALGLALALTALSLLNPLVGLIPTNNGPVLSVN